MAGIKKKGKSQKIAHYFVRCLFQRSNAAGHDHSVYHDPQLILALYSMWENCPVQAEIEESSEKSR
jgi:hypothetical protein